MQNPSKSHRCHLLRMYSLRYHAHSEEGWWPSFTSILSCPLKVASWMIHVDSMGHMEKSCVWQTSENRHKTLNDLNDALCIVYIHSGSTLDSRGGKKDCRKLNTCWQLRAAILGCRIHVKPCCAKARYPRSWALGGLVTASRPVISH